MPLYGYARVSSLDQDLTLQEEMLRAAGCHIVRAEKRSGAGREGRSELRLLLDFLHEGDTLVVTRVDRLARPVKDLQDIRAGSRNLDRGGEWSFCLTAAGL